MSFEDWMIVALMISNTVWIVYALFVRQKNVQLSQRLLEKAQWNWRQAKQWRNNN